MSKRAARDASGVSGGDQKRAQIQHTDVSVRLGVHVMCMIMSYLPQFFCTGRPSWNAESESTRKIIRQVCKSWRWHRYDQWVDPSSAYVLSLKAGNEAQANRLWSMRRHLITIADAPTVIQAAAQCNSLTHVQHHFAKIPEDLTVSAIMAMLRGAGVGGHVGIMQYLLRTHADHLSSTVIFGSTKRLFSTRTPWCLAIMYGQVNLFNFLLDHLFAPNTLYNEFLAQNHVNCAIILAALSNQPRILQLVWRRKDDNQADDVLLELFFECQTNVHPSTLVLEDQALFPEIVKEEGVQMVARFVRLLTPLLTFTQRISAVLALATDALMQSDEVQFVVELLPTIADPCIRSLVLQQFKIGTWRNLSLQGVYGALVEELREYLFDDLHTASIVFCAAVAEKRADMVRYMLDHEKHPQMLQGCGVSALHSACKLGHLDMVKALLATGCIDVTARNNMAMRLAKRNKHYAIVAALQAARLL